MTQSSSRPIPILHVNTWQIIAHSILSRFMNGLILPSLYATYFTGLMLMLNLNPLIILHVCCCRVELQVTLDDLVHGAQEIFLSGHLPPRANGKHASLCAHAS